jgi:lysophospholipase L1-like esterase
MYNNDGTHIVRVFTSGTYTSYTYTGNNPIRMVFGVNTGISFLYKNITSVILSGYVPKNLQGKVVDLNPLTGKKFIVNGDSIPQGAGTIVTYPYPFKVAERLNMNALMYPIGGSTIAYASNFGGAFASLADFNAATKDTTKLYDVQTGMQTYSTYKHNGSSWAVTTAGADNTRTPIAGRYSFMVNDGDVIFVAGGTNDFQYSWSAFGVMADRTPYTFYGALHTLCLGLLTKYPTATIVFATPIKRAQDSYTTPDSTNTLGKTLKDYADAIKEVCGYYSIPVIDLYNISGLNPHVSSQANLFDELLTHPTQDGHNMIARVVTAQIKTLVGI